MSICAPQPFALCRSVPAKNHSLCGRFPVVFSCQLYTLTLCQRVADARVPSSRTMPLSPKGCFVLDVLFKVPLFALTCTSIIAETSITGIEEGATRARTKAGPLAQAVARLAVVLGPSGRVHAEVRTVREATVMDAATQVVAAAVREVASEARAGVLGVHPAPLAPVAIAQVAIEVARKAATSGGAPTAVLPVVETWPVLATALEAATTLGVADARALGAVAQVAQDVVVDGARAPFPRVAMEAVTRTGVLVASANVAAGRVGAARRGAGRGAGAATGLVARLEVAATIPTAGPRRPRVPVRPADA